MRAPGATEHLRVDHDPTPAFEAKLQILRESRRRRARRRLLIAIAIPVVLLLAATTFVLTQRNVTTSVSLDDATAKFRAEDPERARTKSASAAAATTGASSNVKSRPAAVEPAAAHGATAAGMFASLPTQGVYTYSATGGENISVFGANHQYPERVFATVRHLGGCKWEHRLDVIEEHVDRRELCNDGGQLFQLLQARQIEFFGKRDGGTMRCDPPALQHATADEPGTTSSARCVDAKTGDHATARRTFSSMRTLTIEGRSVEAIHYIVDSTFTGHATGTAEDQLWVAPETGMVLRWDRTVDTMADATFGAEVRYREKASFVLESLTPKT